MYRVNLTVKNLLNEVEAVTQVIVVYPFPTVKFVADINEGCSPLKVRFDDQTLASSLTDPASGTVYVDLIQSRSWDFGDGTSVNTSATDVEHSYISSGNRLVKLSVTTNEGCRITGESATDFIRVLDNVKADFFLPPPATCQFPVSAAPNNRSSENVTYTWSSTGPAAVTISDINAASPSFTFTQAGTYRIGLLVKGVNGCTDQLITDYEVFSTTLVNAFSGPDASCDQLPVKFTN